MQPDDTGRIIKACRNLVYIEVGCIRREDGVRGQSCVQISEDILLDLNVFKRGFDHQSSSSGVSIVIAAG